MDLFGYLEQEVAAWFENFFTTLIFRMAEGDWFLNHGPATNSSEIGYDSFTDATGNGEAFFSSSPYYMGDVESFPNVTNLFDSVNFGGGDPASEGGGQSFMFAAAIPASLLAAPVEVEVNGSAPSDEMMLTGVFQGEKYDTEYYVDGTVRIVPNDGGPATTYFSEMYIKASPGLNDPVPPDFVSEPSETTTLRQTSTALPSPTTTASLQSTAQPNSPSPPVTNRTALLEPSVGSAADPATPSTPSIGSASTIAAPGVGGPLTASQQEAESWGAAKAGMWDSIVDIAGGAANLGLRAPAYAILPGLGFFVGAKLPQISFDWAKLGPPKPTGNQVRDAVLLDDYRRGGLVTTTASLAAPFAAEGILGSALSAANKLPVLDGIGMMGGGRFISATEQWLSAGEMSETLGPELDSALVSNSSTVEKPFIATSRDQGRSAYAKFLRESTDPRLANLKVALLDSAGNFQGGRGETLDELLSNSDRSSKWDIA